MQKRLFIFLVLCIMPLALAIGQPQMRFGDPAARKGTISDVVWSEDGGFLDYVNQEQKWQVELKTGIIKNLGKVEQGEAPERRWQFQRTMKMGNREVPTPSRGHQFLTEISPDETWFAVCKNWNVVLEHATSGDSIVVTTEGHRKFRYGTANWTYGEELNVRHGMWWTPDSKKLIYYVFDERPVQDFYLIGNLTEVNTSLLTEGYIKAGAPNPIVWLEIYDLATGTRTPVDVGQKAQDQYIYSMRFTPEGTELLFNRIDRHHHKLEVVALDAATAKTRVVVTEIQETWQENEPAMEFLADGKRFIWETEKSMWLHYELRHLDGRLLKTLTKGEYPDAGIYKIDEKNNYLYYGAYSDKMRLSEQLHRVRLDGKGQERLTRTGKHYSRFEFSPTGLHFAAQCEDVNTPPSTALYTTDGALFKTLAEAAQVDGKRTELFTFKAADGVTELYGALHTPENFDPTQKYPVILNVYGGPDSRAVSNRYQNGSRSTERGYLIVELDNRGLTGRGKAFKAAVYKKLGDVDIADQAEGIKFLRQRSCVDGERVGIVGHSYGGFMAAMGIVKYPDVFAAAVDRAGPTDWRNYDSIYTERYMSLPQDNAEGYDNGSAMKFVRNMTGKLLIMHGMVDDNVHPNNAWQFIDALDRAGKKYESRFFPKSGHGFDGSDTQWDFFDRYLKPAGK